MSLERRILDAVGFIGRFVSDHWSPAVNKQDIRYELRSHGYSSKEIRDAFKWIEDHTIGNSADVTYEFADNLSNRILSPVERTRITPRAHAFLLELTTRGIVDSTMMEEIIEHCLHSEHEEVYLEEMKTIAALCIFNRLQTDWREFLNNKGNSAH